MNNFLIIANKQKDINLEITEQIKHHITRMGAVCNVYDQYNRNVTSIDIPEGTQCILVIGGDGTILAAASMLVGKYDSVTWIKPWNTWLSCRRESC